MIYLKNTKQNKKHHDLKIERHLAIEYFGIRVGRKQERSYVKYEREGSNRKLGDTGVDPVCTYDLETPSNTYDLTKR